MEFNALPKTQKSVKTLFVCRRRMNLSRGWGAVLKKPPRRPDGMSVVGRISQCEKRLDIGDREASVWPEAPR